MKINEKQKTKRIFLRLFSLLKKYKGNQKSFTLIELLVVISILALLASIILVSVRSVRMRARDAHRLTEIKQFGELFEVCFLERGNYPDSDLDPFMSDFWDERGTGWKYNSSCESCFGSFKDAISSCTATPIEDPINDDPFAYFYFYFEPDAITYEGVSINDACKGHYAFMAHLESSGHENNLCFDESNEYEYWFILGY